MGTSNVSTSPDHVARAVLDGEGNGFVLYSADTKTGEDRAKFLKECAAEYTESCFDKFGMSRVPYGELLETVHAANSIFCEPPLSEDEVNRIAQNASGYIVMDECDGPSPYLSIAAGEIYFERMRGESRAPYLKNAAAMIRFLSEHTDMGYPDIAQRKEFVMDVNRYHCEPPLPEYMVDAIAAEVLAKEV